MWIKVLQVRLIHMLCWELNSGSSADRQAVSIVLGCVSISFCSSGGPWTCCLPSGLYLSSAEISGMFHQAGFTGYILHWTFRANRTDLTHMRFRCVPLPGFLLEPPGLAPHSQLYRAVSTAVWAVCSWLSCLYTAVTQCVICWMNQLNLSCRKAAFRCFSYYM